MKRLIFTLIGIVLGLTGLKAVTFTPIEINDPSESVTIKLQPGANYLQLKAIESNTIHFNVGYFGIMMFECNAMGEEGNNLSISYDAEGHKIFSSEVEEGKTYYFSTSMITEPSIDVTIYYGNPLKKQEISFYYDFLPTEGSSLADCSEIIIWLPEEVGVLTFDKVLLQWLNNRGTLQTKEFKAEDVPFAYDKSYAGYVSHIPLAGVSKDREVTLTVEGGMLSNGDSVEITGKFNTDPTGIDSVLGEDANAVVKLYTIDGILVKEAPAATVLTGVKKGVYIMNGKKVVVK